MHHLAVAIELQIQPLITLHCISAVFLLLDDWLSKKRGAGADGHDYKTLCVFLLQAASDLGRADFDGVKSLQSASAMSRTSFPATVPFCSNTSPQFSVLWSTQATLVPRNGTTLVHCIMQETCLWAHDAFAQLTSTWSCKQLRKIEMSPSQRDRGTRFRGRERSPFQQQ